MRILFEPNQFPQDADPFFIKIAKATGKCLLKIIWDGADGYPEHAWGYVQWSVRPYTQWYGCDGTTDANIHFIAKTLCGRLGLVYADLYEQAYSRPQDEPLGQSWVRRFDWNGTEAETVVPELSEITLCGVLHDLEEINNHSLVNLLSNVFTDFGYNIEEYWLRKPEL